MFGKSITTSVLGLSLAILPTEPVQADTGDFVAGAVVGGLVGHALTREHQRRNTVTSNSSSSNSYSAPSIPSTQEGRLIQTSLNYFGFDAGYVDGQLGRRSRNAIASYQDYLGYPVTGQLTPFEHELLVGSYNRAQAGGSAVNQQIASYADGTRGLLIAYREELAGQSAPATDTGQAVTALAPATDTAELPNFASTGAEASLTAHCNQVSLLTNTNGGFTTAATMSDPNVVLNEQFCLARTYAISTSESMISKVQGFTTAQIVEQCKAFGPALEPYVAALETESQSDVVDQVESFIQSTNMPADQMTATAQICLGVGYRTDDMDVALGSALVLFTLGNHAYAEVIGHHLAQGFGVQGRADQARYWYADAIMALDSGEPAVFAPGQPERTNLLRNAALSVDSGSLNGGETGPQPASLPTFGASSN